MNDYRTLNALPASAFLNPEHFKTVNDTVGRGIEQYKDGFATGNNAREIHISAGSTWSATMKDGASLTTSEGIGYHTCTAQLLKGFIDSTAKIIVHRIVGGKLQSTVIKEATV